MKTYITIRNPTNIGSLLRVRPPHGILYSYTLSTAQEEDADGAGEMCLSIEFILDGPDAYLLSVIIRELTSVDRSLYDPVAPNPDGKSPTRIQHSRAKRSTRFNSEHSNDSDSPHAVDVLGAFAVSQSDKPSLDSHPDDSNTRRRHTRRRDIDHTNTVKITPGGHHSTDDVDRRRILRRYRASSSRRFRRRSSHHGRGVPYSTRLVNKTIMCLNLIKIVGFSSLSLPSGILLYVHIKPFQSC